MATKVMSITEYSREDFYEPFVRFLREERDLIILEGKGKKPDRIIFRAPPATKDSTIELRPTAQGFDIYVEVVIRGLLKLTMVGMQPESQVAGVLSRAASKAKTELASTPKMETGTVKFCTRCGASLPLDAVYCQKCGSKQANL